MRLEDLPERYRAQAQEKLAEQTPAARAAKRTSQHAAPMKGGRWRCHGCGHESTTYTAAEKHADESGPGHRRIECMISRPEDAAGSVTRSTNDGTASSVAANLPVPSAATPKH